MAESDFSPEALRKRFHALSARRAKIDAKLDPLRRKLNDLVGGRDKKLPAAARDTQERETRADIVKLMAQLAPIENERAAVARALGGQTGVPDGITFGHKL